MLKRLLNMFFPMFVAEKPEPLEPFTGSIKKVEPKVEPKIKTAKAKLKPVAAPKKKKRGRPPKAKK